MKPCAAVIDSRSADALLALAAREKLIFATRKTDGLFEQICGRHYEAYVEEQLLEQLVLTPNLSLCGYSEYLWDALEGPLVQEGHLANLSAPRDQDLVRPVELPIEVVCGLLRTNMPSQRVLNAATRTQAALEHEAAFERTTGRKAPNLGIETNRSWMHHDGRTTTHYTDEELVQQRHRNSIYATFAPIAEAMDEYARIATLAARFKLMVKTPMIDEPGASIVNPRFSPSATGSELILFRNIAPNLGRTTCGRSIAGTLELARNPASVRFREMMGYWYASLSAGDEQELQRVQREIELATSAQSRLTGARLLGSLSTMIAVPVTVAKLLLGLPPTLGLTLSAVGLISAKKDGAAKDTFKWVTYGGMR
jgi:hypothetical protein